jgi:integrase
MPVKSSKAEITLSLVNAMQPGSMVWDTKVSGLVIRCQKKAKVYGLKYRAAGKQRWFTIGAHGGATKAGIALTPKTARDEARRLLGMIADDRDPARVKAVAKNAITVAEAAARFLEEHVNAKRKPRTAEFYCDILNRIVVPALSSMRLKDVQRSDIAKLHHSLRKAPYMANRTLAVLSKLFNLAEGWGERPDGSNPCRHVEKFPEHKRERFLSPDELAALGDALAAYNGSPYVVAAVKLLVFTGARLQEILTLRWEWISFTRNEARLPDSKTGAKTLHFPPPAMAVLAELPRIEGNPYVIVGAKAGACLVNLEKPWRVIRKTAGLDDVRLHDLRHAFASVAASAGLGLPIIGKMLGHSQPQTTARYAHLASDPVKAAQASVASSIAAAMSGKPTVEVVNITGVKRKA